MRPCTFVYKPSFIYMHASDSLEDAKNEQYLWTEESEANGIGTLEYSVNTNGDSLFNFRIPIDYEEEEDLDLSSYEGKFLVMEINEYSSQSLNAFVDEDEDLLPFSSYNRLAYSFNGILFGDNLDDADDELSMYNPTDGESEERFFEYYEVINGKPILVNA